MELAPLRPEVRSPHTQAARARLIPVVAAAGSGPTTLSAFDAALRHAGVANYNLIRLSSVIPPGWVAVNRGAGPVQLSGQWGDRLYVVMAEQRTDRVGEEAWAGVGWVQDRVSGRGLLVEHEGTEEAAVRADIDASLAALCAGRRGRFGPSHSLVQGTVCRAEAVCALVIAAFGAVPWSAPEPVLRLP